jgi:hypothetical protein
VTARAWRWRRDESGFVATEFAFGVSVLVLPVTLLVLTFPQWSERQVTARVIAREVARRAARDAYCDRDAAAALGATMARNFGVTPRDVVVDLECGDGTGLAAGSEVEVHVTVTMPAVQLPGLGAFGAWSWTAIHREPVDQYVSAR